MRTLLDRFTRRSQPPPIPQVQPADVPAPAPVKARGQKILIVDDDAVVLKAVGLKLEAHGYGVITAAEGSAAIRAARNEKPDLILLDLSFPSDVSLAWDGFVIMTWLRRLEETRHIPVIVVTNGDPVKYQNRSLSTGATDFFRKPVTPDSLLASIEHALSGAGTVRKSSDFQI